jgi:hypothetical protein
MYKDSLKALHDHLVQRGSDDYWQSKLNLPGEPKSTYLSYIAIWLEIERLEVLVIPTANRYALAISNFYAPLDHYSWPLAVYITPYWILTNTTPWTS